MNRQWLFWCKVLLPLLLLCTLTFYWLYQTLARPVGQVAIYGTVQHVDLQTLQQRALPWLTLPFWKVDLNGLQQALTMDPWLAAVQVTRRWPDQIHLTLTERRAWARVNEDALVDEQGVLFYPDVSSFPAVSRSLQVSEDQLDEALAFWHLLEPVLSERGLRLTELQLEARGAWQFQVNGAVRVALGRDTITQRMDRFLWAWDHWLADEMDDLSAVDLRYPNGLSVHRKHD